MTLYELTLMALAAALAAAVVALPWPFNLIAGIVIGALMTGVFIALGVQLVTLAQLQGRIVQTHQDLLAARSDFDAAVAEVMATCDSECWSLVDMDQPACPADEAVSRRRPLVALPGRR